MNLLKRLSKKHALLLKETQHLTMDLMRVLELSGGLTFYYLTDDCFPITSLERIFKGHARKTMFSPRSCSTLFKQKLRR
uniref:Uncharacterized protein n=1 Tax=Megaselia scalaris TaxID=36166 RepID=T1GS85_MEGSC